MSNSGKNVRLNLSDVRASEWVQAICSHKENEMDHNSLQSTEESPEQAATGRTSRLFFIDHLRAALVILVVLHHIALVYGGIPPFYYLEPPNPTNDLLAGLVLFAFVLFNQAWFMGAFFLIAGYFTPGSFDRKGPGSFLRDRLLRLGIPLIVFIFVLSPISMLGLYLMPASQGGIATPLTWQTFPYLAFLGLGPLWFVAMLLIFSFGYAGWRRLTRNRISTSMSKSSAPNYLSIGIFILALALVSYLVRIVVPLGEPVILFVYFLSFPTIAYLPQYLSFFVLGIIASRHDWFRTTPGSMGVVGFVAALVATVLLFSIAFISLLTSIENGSQQLPAFGYGTWQSAVYTLWDSIFAVGLSLAAITFFRRFFNGESRFGGLLSQQSYAVYIIHTLIIVFLAFVLRGIDLEHLLKFGMATVIAIPTCFAAAYIVRKIPGVSRVL
jgi:glucan biosynthesis protein C